LGPVEEGGSRRKKEKRGTRRERTCVLNEDSCIARGENVEGAKSFNTVWSERATITVTRTGEIAHKRISKGRKKK